MSFGTAGPRRERAGTRRPFPWLEPVRSLPLDPLVRVHRRHLAWIKVGLWGHVDSTEWRITLEPEGNGTRIVQSYDVVHVLPGVDKVYWLLITAHRDRSDALVQDVDRLAALAASGAPAGPAR